MVNFQLNIKSEKNKNVHVGTPYTMHWQWIYAQNLSEMSIYKVTRNENVIWYNLVTFLHQLCTATWQHLREPQIHYGW